MKSLKQIIFSVVMVVGLAFSVSAQKDDQKKPRPPKDPPVIKPGDKDRPRPPKGDDKPKKPDFAFVLIVDRRSDEIV